MLWKVSPLPVQIVTCKISGHVVRRHVSKAMHPTVWTWDADGILRANTGSRFTAHLLVVRGPDGSFHK